jgi:CRP/FNR family cyclic AMP-dependent transcriptional regulator
MPDDILPFLTEAGPGKTITARPSGETIYVQGSEASSLFYIQSGRVKLTVTSELGKEAIVAVLGPGQFFGEASLHDVGAHVSTSATLEDSVVLAIAKVTAHASLRANLDFAAVFTQHLLKRTARIEEDLVDQLFNSTEKRLARLLLRLAEYGAEDRPPVVPVTLTQEELAEMIGATRSRVSHFMARFRRLGYITYNGKIEVHHSLLSAMLADKQTISEE